MGMHVQMIFSGVYTESEAISLNRCCCWLPIHSSHRCHPFAPPPTLHTHPLLQVIRLPKLDRIQLDSTDIVSLEPDPFLPKAKKGGGFQIMRTPDIRTNFDDIAALAVPDLTFDQCYQLEDISVIHGKLGT